MTETSDVSTTLRLMQQGAMLPRLLWQQQFDNSLAPLPPQDYDVCQSTTRFTGPLACDAITNSTIGDQRVTSATRGCRLMNLTRQ